MEPKVPEGGADLYHSTNHRIRTRTRTQRGVQVHGLDDRLVPDVVDPEVGEHAGLDPAGVDDVKIRSTRQAAGRGRFFRAPTRRFRSS
jgi:hypothetical protein